MNKPLNEQQLKAVCDALADTSRGLTKTELGRLLEQCRIELVDDGRSNNGFVYTVGLNKRDWLYNCFAKYINKNQSFSAIYQFIERALNPVRYTNESNRENYDYIFEETNKALLLGNTRGRFFCVISDRVGEGPSEQASGGRPPPPKGS